MAAAYLLGRRLRRLGFGPVGTEYDTQAIEFRERGARLRRAAAALEQFREDKILARLVRPTRNGTLLRRTRFGQSILPSQHHNQQIKGVRLPDIDVARAHESLNRM